MKKGYITVEMFNRIKVIDRFVKINKRLPNNTELAKMFGGSVGQKTVNILKVYEKSLKTCFACGSNLCK